MPPPRHLQRRALRPLVTLGVLATACTPEAWQEGHLRLVERQIQPLQTASLAVRTSPGDAAVAFTFEAEDPLRLAYTARVRGRGQGQVFAAEDWWERADNYTNAAFLDNTTVFNWPVTRADPPLAVDSRYRATARFADEPGRWLARAAVKQDQDLQHGTVYVRLVLDEQVANTPNWDEAIDRAVDLWQQDIFDDLGTTLILHTDKVVRPLRTAISAPGFGDQPLYRALSAERDVRWIDLVLVRAIEQGPGIFGVAGGIPGPIGSTGRSAVLISMEESAGADGLFQDFEVQILAETMAHEVGHYLGLFHPIELPSGDAISAWDALEDTHRCTTFVECIRTLGDNVMFPTPICIEPDPESVEDGSTAGDLQCLRQTRLTPDQQGVIQRYVLVE